MATTDRAADWPLYQGTKQLKAIPMNKRDYCVLRGWPVPADEDADEPGYVVEYQDNDSKPNVEGFANYVSWTPATVFDKTYRPCGTYAERMAVELADLDLKINRLSAFMQVDGFMELDQHQRMLLRMQHYAMSHYRSVLAERIALA